MEDLLHTLQPEEVHKPRIFSGGCQKACSTNIAIEILELFWEIHRFHIDHKTIVMQNLFFWKKVQNKK